MPDVSDHGSEDSEQSVISQTFPLGPQWPTLDPFLFTAYHDDAFPAGTQDLGPEPSQLDGRDIGMDFSSKDGWSMYHASNVPGFPAHPHRGFETITYLRSGLCDHTDSLGAAARFGQGDTQWVTSGRGIVHAEMFPLVHADQPNPMELFQIWLNLPAADKMVDPYFTMLWSEETPRHKSVDSNGRAANVTVIAGTFAGEAGQAPPPNSWASRPEADIAIWHMSLEAGAELVIPPAASAETNRVLYVFDGSSVQIQGQDLAAGTGVVLDPTAEVTMVGGDGPVDCMILQGRPIGEPVAKYGPFVMNTEDEIQQTFRDYQATNFGGWPWSSDDPNHGDIKQGRFARYADGRTENRTTQPA